MPVPSRGPARPSPSSPAARPARPTTPARPRRPRQRGTASAALRAATARCRRGRAVARREPRPEPVRHATATEGDPVVRGALRVDVGVRGVAEHLPTRPADVRPRPRGQRCGHDHGRVHRQPGAPLAGQTCGEPLRRADDAPSCDRAAGGLDTPRAKRGDPRVLEDLDAPGLGGAGQPGHEPRGCSRAACGCQAAPRISGMATALARQARRRAARRPCRPTAVPPRPPPAGGPTAQRWWRRSTHRRGRPPRRCPRPRRPPAPRRRCRSAPSAARVPRRPRACARIGPGRR